MQLIIGTVMFAMSFHAEKFLQNVGYQTYSRARNPDPPLQPADNIYFLSAAFTGLVSIAATQGS